MFVIVAYDVNTSSDGGKARLRKVAKECVNYGQRVQNSVFEINLEYGKFILLKDRLLKLIDNEKDSLRFYYLGDKWEKRVEHFGAKEGYNSEGVLII
ncbi:MAG: CRISPR-associated endonuclease Cas2 [Clostridia bacterium]|nr:CRISPR-associated endonuclease Cas2 [Clostridia bacterium]